MARELKIKRVTVSDRASNEAQSPTSQGRVLPGEELSSAQTLSVTELRLPLSRRALLKTGMLTAATASLAACHPKPPVTPVGQYTERVAMINGRKVYVRRRLSNWTAQDYTSYRQGVLAMQARPISDPTSWLFQANIHGAPRDAGDNPAWRQCPHGNMHFMSWHRMYLYFWERIIRKASGDPDFSIGYWRYEASVPGSLSLPEPFRSPTSGNSLYLAERRAAINAGEALPPSTVLADAALSEGAFLAPPNPGFSRALEASPHNNVHVQISGFMGQVALAARDPIFWTHHGNIDRYWKRWLDNAAHANPESGPFLTTVFSFSTKTAEPWL